MITIVFLFLLNLIFRDLGRFLGKGLPAGIILEFFVLNLAWIIALAIPMAVLVATLMAFGRLSSDHEIAALKAGGVHLYRLMAPVFIIAIFISIGMERFNNSILPDFNHRVRLLYSDISRKRPTLALEPHVFFDELPNYSLLVHKMEENGTLLKGVIINDYTDPLHSKTVIAESGRLEFSQAQERMVLTLYDGEIHDVDRENLEDYRRLKFQQQVFSIPVPDMVLKRSNSQRRGDREKSVKMMREDIRRDEKVLRDKQENVREIVRNDLEKVFPESFWEGKLDRLEKRTSSDIFQGRNVNGRNQSILQQIQGELRVIRGCRRSINALEVEIQKKYSIPIACIVFVLVGAPLGIMARQGGMAFGGGMSLGFFLIYWAFLIGGEQLADRGFVGPVLAMWAPNIIVGLGGIYLVIRSVKESKFIHWERWGQWIRRIGQRTKA
jgi:lipopolysaccharide export system permease protein